MPSLFNLNIDTNIDPTLNFYIDALGDEAKALAFVAHPISFGYSLEKRLKPRLQEAKEAGINVDSKFLSSMMTYTEDGWNKRLTRKRQIAEESYNLADRLHRNCSSGISITLFFITRMGCILKSSGQRSC